MSNSKPVSKYDSNGNEIYYKDRFGHEEWGEYDANGNLIHFKNSDGFEIWREYDANGNMIHYKDSDGDEVWYDSDGNPIDKPTEKKYNSAMSNNDINDLISQLNERQRREFALWCVERARPLLPISQPHSYLRSIAALDVTVRHLKGEATADELSSALTAAQGTLWSGAMAIARNVEGTSNPVIRVAAAVRAVVADAAASQAGFCYPSGAARDAEYNAQLAELNRILKAGAAMSDTPMSSRIENLEKEVESIRANMTLIMLNTQLTDKVSRMTRQLDELDKYNDELIQRTEDLEEENKMLRAAVSNPKHHPLELMWQELESYKEQANTNGHGKSWARMCKERTESAAVAAAVDVAAAAAAREAAAWASEAVRYALDVAGPARANSAIDAIRRAKEAKR
jgi:YD repeat-containing protein